MLFLAMAGALVLTSPDIRNGATIPDEQIYTRCGGKNISPALSWSGVPANAKGLALTMIDTSVKPHGWSHWVLLDVPLRSTGLAKGATGIGHGVKSNFGDDNYDGPCPPTGSGLHRYEITLWVLKDAAPALQDDEPADQVEAALKTASSGSASIAGTVTR